MTTGPDLSPIDAHELYLRTEGAQGTRLNISGMALAGAQLAGVDLASAVLVDADLRGADLRGANLGGAELPRADLSGANLTAANLNKADFGHARLQGARLHAAQLIRTDLGYTDLSNADLSRTYLVRSYVAEANLRGVNLTEADLDRPIFAESTWGQNVFTGAVGRVFLESVTLSEGYGLTTLDPPGFIAYAGRGGARLIAIPPGQPRPETSIPWRWGTVGHPPLP